MLLLLIACLHKDPPQGQDTPPGSEEDQGTEPTSGPSLAGCPVFPADDPWNLRVDSRPVDADWTERLHQLVGDIGIHPDFGNYIDPPIAEHYGIPYNVVPTDQPMVQVELEYWPEESDPGPYPFPEPAQAHIEGGNPRSCDGDCHMLVVQQETCRLYEAWACRYERGWVCANGAVWDLRTRSLGQRPEGWTSADAGGLPILPGLARYEEAAAGAIEHALRFTVHCTRGEHVPPATHHAVPDDCRPGEEDLAPPMGLRVRLRADFDTSGFSPEARVFLLALQRYGMILADNGGDFYFQSTRDERWGAAIDELKQVPASAFEALVAEDGG